MALRRPLFEKYPSKEKRHNESLIKPAHKYKLFRWSEPSKYGTVPGYGARVEGTCAA